MVKVKYKESKETKQMREIFERMEKQALKGNKIYIDLSKAKKQQMAKISEREKLGLGEEYVDSDRSIAVGMGEQMNLVEGTEGLGRSFSQIDGKLDVPQAPRTSRATF